MIRPQMENERLNKIKDYDHIQVIFMGVADKDAER